MVKLKSSGFVGIFFLVLFFHAKPIQPCITTYTNPTVLGYAQLNTISTQMSAYVHKSLLSGYSWYRAAWYNIVVYVTISLEGMTEIRYDRFRSNKTSVYSAFTEDENSWAAMMTCETHMPSKYPRVPPYPLLPYDPVSNNPATNNTASYDLALPLFLYEVVVVFKVPGLTTLQLSRDSMMKIFTGLYTKWSDIPATAYTGQTITDPTQSITMYIISQPNKFSDIICKYVKNAGANWTWADMEAKCMTGDMFPASATKPTFKRVRSADGALASLTNTPYSITYTSRPNLIAYGKAVTTASIQNAAGNYVSANFTTLNATIYGNNITVNANGTGLVDLPNATAYPLIGMSFISVRSAPDVRNGPPVDIYVSSEVLRYYRWVNRDPSARGRLYNFEALPIPNVTYDAMTTFIKKEWWATMPNQEDNTTYSVWAEMEYQSSQEQLTDFQHIFLVYILPPVIAFIFVAYLTWRLILWFILYRKVHHGVYQIPAEDIVFIETSKERYRCMLHGRAYLDSRPETEIPFLTGEYKSGVVLLRSFPMAFNTSSLRVRQELIHMQEWRCHKNLVKFLGVAEVRRQRYIVSELSLLGDLRTLLNSVSQQHLLTQPVRFNMARGVAEGMRYLHEQDIVHGNLRSSSVYVESDWSVKISDWEYAHLYSLQGTFVAKEQTFKKVHRIPKLQQIPLTVPHLWTAPELIKAAVDQTGLLPHRTADIYSYGIIFYEILTSCYPYKWNPSTGPPLPIIMRILNAKKPLRPLDLETPETLAEIPDSMLRLMKSCWHVEPERRVTSHGISVILAEVQAETKRMADLTIINTDFFIEKQKAEIKNYNSDLRQRVLDLKRAGEEFQTPVVYERTRSKMPTEPELIEKAYIMHITMVEYSELLGETHGESAIALIERFQTMINQHLLSLPDPNIFRLHASGDDCTILCGIPEGGLQYADAIATMAFDILTITWKAVMLDIDIDHIKIRIGIHCGPVLAGLYGGEHSEYTIIGDNRDIAEDMERLSATFRILISEDFLEDLKHFNGYSYILNTDRSRFHEKKTTYWLVGREKYPFQESLDEIHTEFGSITDGRVPLAPKKKVKSAMAGAAPLERVQARRTSVAAYDAQKSNVNRASILERRKPRDKRISRGSLGPDAVRKSMKSNSIVEPDEGENARIDVVKLRNTELIVVDFDDDDEHALAMADAQRRFLYPGPPTSGLSVIKEASSIGFESSQRSSQKSSEKSEKKVQPQDTQSIEQSLAPTDQPSNQSSTVTEAESIIDSVSQYSSNTVVEGSNTIQYSSNTVVESSSTIQYGSNRLVEEKLSELESFVTNSSVHKIPSVSVPRPTGPVRMTASETIRTQPGVVAHPNPFTLAVQTVKSDTTSQPVQMTVSETVTTQPTVVSHPNPFILAGLISGKRSAKVAPASQVQSVTVEMTERSSSIKSVQSVTVDMTERSPSIKSVPSIQLSQNSPSLRKVPSVQLISQTDLGAEPLVEQNQSATLRDIRPTVKDRLSVLEKQSAQSAQSDRSERSERPSVAPSWSIRSQAGSTRTLAGTISGVSSIKTWSTLPHDIPSLYSNQLETPSVNSSVTNSLTPLTKQFPSFDASSLTMTGHPPAFTVDQPNFTFESTEPLNTILGVSSVRTLPQAPSSNPATVGSFTCQNQTEPLFTPEISEVGPNMTNVDFATSSLDGNVVGVTSVKTWATLPGAPSSNPRTVGTLASQAFSNVVVNSTSAEEEVVVNFVENSRTFSNLVIPGVASVRTWASLPGVVPSTNPDEVTVTSSTDLPAENFSDPVEKVSTWDDVGVVGVASVRTWASLPEMQPGDFSAVNMEPLTDQATTLGIERFTEFIEHSKAVSSMVVAGVASVRTWASLPGVPSVNTDSVEATSPLAIMLPNQSGSSMEDRMRPSSMFSDAKSSGGTMEPVIGVERVDESVSLQKQPPVFDVSVPMQSQSRNGGMSAEEILSGGGAIDELVDRVSVRIDRQEEIVFGEGNRLGVDVSNVEYSVGQTVEPTEAVEDGVKGRVKNQWRSLLDKQVTRRRSSLPVVMPLIVDPTMNEPTNPDKSERVLTTWWSLVDKVQQQRRQSLTGTLPTFNEEPTLTNPSDEVATVSEGPENRRYSQAANTPNTQRPSNITTFPILPLPPVQPGNQSGEDLLMPSSTANRQSLTDRQAPAAVAVPVESSSTSEDAPSSTTGRLSLTGRRQSNTAEETFAQVNPRTSAVLLPVFVEAAPVNQVSDEPFPSTEAARLSVTSRRLSDELSTKEDVDGNNENISNAARLSLTGRKVSTVPSVSLPEERQVMSRDLSIGSYIREYRPEVEDDGRFQSSAVARLSLTSRKLSDAPTANRVLTARPTVILVPETDVDDLNAPLPSTANRLSLSNIADDQLPGSGRVDTDEDGNVSSNTARFSLTGRNISSEDTIRLALEDRMVKLQVERLSRMEPEEPLLTTANRLSLTPRNPSVEPLDERSTDTRRVPTVERERDEKTVEIARSRRESRKRTSTDERRMIEVIQAPIVMSPSEVEEVMKKRRRSSVKSNARRRSSTRPSTVTPVQTTNQANGLVDRSDEVGPSTTANRLSVSTRQPSYETNEQNFNGRKSKRSSKVEVDTVVENANPVVVVPVLAEDEPPHAQKERKRKKKLQPHHSIHSHRSIDNPMDHLPAGQLSPLERREKLARRESRDEERMRRESASRVVPWLAEVEIQAIAVGEGPMVVEEVQSVQRGSPPGSERMADLVGTGSPSESLSWLTDADGITQTGLPRKPRESR